MKAKIMFDLTKGETEELYQEVEPLGITPEQFELVLEKIKQKIADRNNPIVMLGYQPIGGENSRPPQDE